MGKKIFISYSWDDSDDVNRLDNLFMRFQIPLTRDIRNLEYNANIHDFMDTVRLHDKVILYVSDSYLRSVNCMYEAFQALNNQSNIIIIVKKGTKVFSVEDKSELINYWKQKYQEVSRMDAVCFHNEINDTKIAYKSISEFIDFIKQPNRMNNESIDFDVLLDSLQVEKAYPEIVTKPVYDWIAKYPQAKLFEVLTLINDLYRSTDICFSEFPNIPDNEKFFSFQKIQFEDEFNGITLKLFVTDKKDGRVKIIIYPHLVEIEENDMRSNHHAKYYFHCEEPSKKQKYMELENMRKYRHLNDKEEDILSYGYNDTYRIIIHF